MQETNQKLWNFNYILLLCLCTIVTGAFHMTSPLISKYAILMGATLSFAGVIAGIYSVSAMLMRPVAGTAADKMNKKRLLVCSTFGIAFSVLGYFIAQDPLLLFFFRFVHGLCFGISSTVNTVLASQYVPKNRLGEGIGYLGMSNVLGTAVGPNIGLLIADQWGVRISFLLSFCCMLTAACLMLFLPDQAGKKTPKKPRQKRRILRLRDVLAPEIIPLSAFGSILMVTNGNVASYLVLVGDVRGIGSIGLYFTVNAMVMLLTRPMAGKVSDRYGITCVLLPAFCCSTVAMFLLSVADSLPLVLLVAVLQAFGVGMGHPALQAESIRRLGSEHSGVATGTYYLGADLGIGVGPMIGGVIAAHYGYAVMYSATGCLLLLGLVALLLYLKRGKTNA